MHGRRPSGVMTDPPRSAEPAHRSLRFATDPDSKAWNTPGTQARPHGRAHVRRPTALRRALKIVGIRGGEHARWASEWPTPNAPAIVLLGAVCLCSGFGPCGPRHLVVRGVHQLGTASGNQGTREYELTSTYPAARSYARAHFTWAAGLDGGRSLCNGAHVVGGRTDSREL